MTVDAAGYRGAAREALQQQADEAADEAGVGRPVALDA